MKFRNPQGDEQNWINGGGQIGHYAVYLGKVVTAEIGVSLLCVTSLVESAAYFVLLIPSVVISQSLLRKNLDLLSSSGFTLLWNIGNLAIFNLFYLNVSTHESFARYSIDHWQRGQVLKIALKTADFALFCLAFFSKPAQTPPSLIPLFQKPFLRIEDQLFIMQRMGEQQMPVPLLNIDFDTAQYDETGFSADQREEGTRFFTEYFLHPGQLTEETKQLIIDTDPAIYDFVLTRSVYLYVFGPKRTDPLPSFFKLSTQLSIAKLRLRYRQNAGQLLEPLMQNHAAFNSDPTEPLLRRALYALKEVAYGELTGSLFLTSCWENACFPQP